MIDEKKIEEAARKYAEEQERLCNELAEKYKSASSICTTVSKNPDAAFKDGIDWFLDNLWHDASEEPEKDKLVLTDTRSIANKEHICWQAVKLTDNGFIRNWSNYVKATKITRWLYIEDLMKGGK